MKYIVSARTNKGIKKNNNQDAVTIKTARTAIGDVAFAVLCDGMGGLSEGEIASATVVSEFSNWFYQIFPKQILADNFSDNLFSTWDEIIKKCNVKLHEYGLKNGIKLGTTCSVLLVMPNYYFIAHVGDSRIYTITNQKVSLLTEDQTFVAREVKEGRMTKADAEIDARKNVLLQCIGASNIVKPDFLTDSYTPGIVFMLCSDGFRHLLTEKEIFDSYMPDSITDSSIINKNSDYLIDVNMNRGEEDNITVAVIKTI